MTEADILKRAKMYIDKLANGINPLDDTPLPETDAVNNIRISRCLFYVSGILEQVLENGGSVRKRIPRENFHISSEQIQKFQFSDTPIPISEIAKRINALTENENMKKITYNNIADWLIDIEMLSLETKADGKTGRLPTEKGIKLGIFTENREGMYGAYTVVLYNRDAQQFITDNIDAVTDMIYRR